MRFTWTRYKPARAVNYVAVLRANEMTSGVFRAVLGYITEDILEVHYARSGAMRMVFQYKEETDDADCDLEE
jgi:hypothetical protein